MGIRKAVKNSNTSETNGGEGLRRLNKEMNYLNRKALKMLKLSWLLFAPPNSIKAHCIFISTSPQPQLTHTPFPNRFLHM